jgi:hypothetical protein
MLTSCLPPDFEFESCPVIIIFCHISSCWIPGLFWVRKLPSRYRRTHGPHTCADCCPARRQTIRTFVYLRVLNSQRPAARQLLFVEYNARRLAWLVTSNLASKNNTLSLSTLLCRRRHHASEVKQLFSTRSLSDVSCGKVRSLTEWRNTPVGLGLNPSYKEVVYSSSII